MADYLLKGNQGKVHGEVQLWFADHACDCGGDMRPSFDALDDAIGRLLLRPNSNVVMPSRDGPDTSPPAAAPLSHILPNKRHRH